VKAKSLLRRVGVLSAAFAIFPLMCWAGGAPVSGYKVVEKYPHSTDNYTEGFFYLDGLFYEGTGLKGHSAVMSIDPQTGRVQQRAELPGQYFGEGIVDWGPNIYEWTWQSHICFVYDRFGMRPVKQFTYTGEGWGTHAPRKRSSPATGLRSCVFGILRPSKKFATSCSKMGQSQSNNSTNLSIFTAKSTQMCGIRTGLSAYPRSMAT
jgi:glutamine cyclotransferase